MNPLERSAEDAIRDARCTPSTEGVLRAVEMAERLSSETASFSREPSFFRFLLEPYRLLELVDRAAKSSVCIAGEARSRFEEGDLGHAALLAVESVALAAAVLAVQPFERDIRTAGRERCRKSLPRGPRKPKVGKAIPKAEHSPVPTASGEEYPYDPEPSSAISPRAMTNEVAWDLVMTKSLSVKRLKDLRLYWEKVGGWPGHDLQSWESEFHARRNRLRSLLH